MGRLARGIAEVSQGQLPKRGTRTAAVWPKRYSRAPAKCRGHCSAGNAYPLRRLREFNMSRLKHLSRFGQSIWIDYISRRLLTGGGLQRLIVEDGLRGLTSNPAIFEKAITNDEE
jgi:hypothetical protein